MARSPGERLGAFELISGLGAGGMGEVYLAQDLTLDRLVALKFLPLEVTSDPDRVARFRQEARAASALNHPNVCTIHALAETADGQHYIAMEYVQGETLRQHLTGRPLQLQEVIAIGIQLSSALTAAHAAGVLHRDLKPENVILRPDGLVKVLDFGLAKLTRMQPIAGAATISAVDTAPGTVAGTIAYMSPEQARGQDVDARTDIWSFGVMLYEMIAGRTPFAGPSTNDVIAAILHGEPMPLARFTQYVPDELQRIVGKLLRKERGQRYQLMRELLLDLQALRDEPSIHSTHTDENTQTGDVVPPASPIEHTPPESSAEYIVAHLTTHKLRVGVLAAAVLMAVAAGWWALSDSRAAAPVKPSVVVLPFSTIGAGDDYFADGITEAVTTELGRVGGLRVIASNTAFGYRNDTRFRDIGRRLGVGLVVRGSVQREGSIVRIDVSLIDTNDDTAIWSEHYSREMTKVLTVQDEISQEIANTLSRTFGTTSTTSTPSLSTRNVDAYDAYLRGLWHLKGRSSDTETGAMSVARRTGAITELERAVRHDPNFALAQAALASAYTQRFFYDTTDEETEQRAFLAIQKALSLKADLGEAYLARAQLTWNLSKGFPHERAVADLRKALKCNPNLAEAYAELSKVFYHVGLTDKAVEANDNAERLDPSAKITGGRRLRALTDAGRLNEVRDELTRHPNQPVFARAEALLAMGNLNDALEVLLQSRTVDRSDPEADTGSAALLGLVYARLNRREDAKRVMAAIIPVAENPGKLSHLHHAQIHIGATLAQLGRPEEALRWLTMAANQGYPSYTRFSNDRNLDPLRGQGEFEALLARLRQDHQRWQSMPEF
jgi:serine/threonine protein kinase/tetratricopeptide (TPR) repeat protein